MRILIYVPLAVSVLAAVGAWPLAERLPPRTATWLLTVSAVIIAGTSGAALGLLAMAAAMRLPVVAAMGGMSLRTVGQIDPDTLPVGVIAASLFGAAVLCALRAAWLRTMALIGAHRDARGLAGDRQVVVIADESADAYAVPGRRGTIVVTSGMLEALTEPERDVLLAHEQAHTAARHYLFTALVRLSAAANPLLRPLASAVGYTVERWADERAAVVTGSRPLAARAIANAALAAAAHPPRRTGGSVLASLAGSDQLGRRGSVPRRVGALMGPPPKRRIVLLVATIGVVAVCGVAAVHAAGDLHAMVEFAQAAT